MQPSVKRLDSSNENVSKYVFEFGDAVAEAVLYKYPTYEDRTVICCSTQSGCPVGCRFCGAGDAFVRSLTAEEILYQVEHLFKDRQIDTNLVQKCQIMFMSMGEPMLNYKALSEAIRELYRRYPRFSLLISTSGPKVPYEPLIELSTEIPTIGLQFSVHDSLNEKRDELIPFENKLDLWEISTVGEKWYSATGRQPFFNYCAGENNSSLEDARRIYNIFNPKIWQATISVICERDEKVSAANERQRNLASDFMQKLGYYGFSTRMFDPAGQDDIGGGCGQLWFVQEWMREHPNLAKPSVGCGMPQVHTPGYSIDV